MFTQYYDNHGCDSGLLWICNRCLFPNFYTSLLLNDSFSATVSNSFGSLFSLSSPGPPLRSSSPTIPAPPRKKPVERKLKVVSLNCNGLKGLTKRAEFHSYIELHQPDIILGCESKVDTDIPTYSIFPESYDIFRKDRSSSEGGVFIAVRNDLVAVKVRRLGVKGFEVVTVCLLTKQRNSNFNSFYRPPTPLLFGPVRWHSQ